MGLGKFLESYNLEIISNVQSKIVPYRRVPLAVRDKYEAKLRLLIEQGVVGCVDGTTDWTNHVVVDEKAD